MDDVATLRRFNRTYTQRIGVLAESYLGRGRPLGPSRVLYEVGTGSGRVGDLRRRLGLDSGYLSRLLRQLEEERLVTVERDERDGRQRRVRLTARGRRELERLDQRSEALAQGLLEPLPERLRAELTAALATADRLLRAATVELVAVDARGAEAQHALARYFAELGERFGFDPERGGAADDACRPPGGRFLVVRSDGETIGCGGVQRHDATTAEIKRMWIDAAWRGFGLGSRLLAGLEATARELGHRRVVLDTNETLTPAIALYERSGYAAIDRYNDNPYAHRWFAKAL